MNEINRDVLEIHDNIKNPEELTNVEKNLFLKLDPTLFNQATFFELKNQMTQKNHVASKIKKIVSLEEEIINLPNNDEGVKFLVDNVFDGKWISEDIGRILIILKGEGYYNKKIDCTAGKGLLKAIQGFFSEEEARGNQHEGVSESNHEKSKSLGMNSEIINQLANESGLSNNEIIEISFEFNELNELVESGKEEEAKGKLGIIAAKYGDKMGSFLDIASHPGMGCAPVLAFMKSPIARNMLKGVSIVGGLGMRKKFFDAYEQGKGVGETVRSMGKYFIPFVGNYWDFKDGTKDINKGNIGMGCLNFASGIIGTGLDVLSIFPPAALAGQPAKVGTKMGIKGAIKMISNGESLLKVGKHVSGVFMETALSMKSGFIKFTDELVKMKKSPVYRKKIMSKIGDQMLTKIDTALPMITKFEEYAKSLPWLIGRPMEIFIKSIKPVIYGGVDALRGMTDTMTFRNIRKASKAANNAKDASKATEDISPNKEASEQIKIQKNTQAIGIITKFIKNNPKATLPDAISVYYNKHEISKRDTQDLQTFLRENGYYEKGANSKSDGDIGKATIKALENWEVDFSLNLKKGNDVKSKEKALSTISVPKSLSEAISVIKTLAKTTSGKVNGKIESIIGGKLDDISTAIKDNIINRSGSAGFSSLKNNLQNFATNVKTNARGILDNYELVTLSGNKVGATAGMFDIPIFKRKRKKGKENIKIKYKKMNLKEKGAKMSFEAKSANKININIGGKDLQLVKGSEYGFNTPYALVDAHNPTVEFKGLRVGETISLGRSNPGRFSFPGTVSRDHLRVRLDQNGNISIINYGTNGTSISISYTETIKQKAKEESKENSKHSREEKLEKGIYQEIATSGSLKLGLFSTVGINARSKNGLLSISNGNKVFIMRNGEEIVLGRHFKNNFFGFDASVSSAHCHIKLKDGKVYVKDISSNGTFGFKLGGEPNAGSAGKEKADGFDSSKTESHEHYKFLSKKMGEMKIGNIVTMKFPNGVTFSFKKISESGDIKLIHSSKSDLNAMSKTGKIFDTKSGPAFIYEINGKKKGIKMNNTSLETVDKKIMHNIDYGTVNSLLVNLRQETQKRENGEMGININESKQFIQKYESGKISEKRKEQYDYHKKKIEEYSKLQSNLIYYTELISKFN